MNKDARSYEEVFEDRKEDLVYLTADSPHELETLNPQHIYIIGASIFAACDLVRVHFNSAMLASSRGDQEVVRILRMARP